MSYDTRLLNQESQISDLSPEWEACLRKLDRRHIEHHPDWAAIQARSQAERNWKHAVVTLHRGDDLVGVAPFLLKDWTWSCRLGYKTVARFPIQLGDLCGQTPLLPDDRSAREALLHDLCRRDLPFQMLFFESLPTDSDWFRLLHDSPELRRHFWVYLPEGIATHWLIRLPESFEAYHRQQFDKGRRKKIRKWLRHLEENPVGEVRLQQVTGRDDVPEFLRHVERISERSWQGSRLGQVIRETPAEIERLGAYADRGWLRGCLLHFGSEAVGFQIGYQFDGVLYLEETGYDPAWAEYSPGNLLLYRLLEELYRADDLLGRPDLIDFGYGDNQNKTFFCNASYADANVYLIRKSFYTALAYATHRSCAAFSGLARHTLDRLRLRETVRQWLRGRPPQSKAPR